MVLARRVVWVKSSTVILPIFPSERDRNVKCNFANNFFIFLCTYMKIREKVHFSNTNITKHHKIHKMLPNFTKGCQMSQYFDLASTLCILDHLACNLVSIDVFWIQMWSNVMNITNHHQKSPNVWFALTPLFIITLHETW